MKQITVVCNEPHEINPAVCAFCERDRERARLAGVMIAIEGSGPPVSSAGWAYSPVQDAALDLRARWAQAETDARRYRMLRAMVGVLNVEIGRIIGVVEHSFSKASPEDIRIGLDAYLDAIVRSDRARRGDGGKA